MQTVPQHQADWLDTGMGHAIWCGPPAALHVCEAVPIYACMHAEDPPECRLPTLAANEYVPARRCPPNDTCKIEERNRVGIGPFACVYGRKQACHVGVSRCPAGPCWAGAQLNCGPYLPLLPTSLPSRSSNLLGESGWRLAVGV